MRVMHNSRADLAAETMDAYEGLKYPHTRKGRGGSGGCYLKEQHKDLEGEQPQHVEGKLQ